MTTLLESVTEARDWASAHPVYVALLVGCAASAFNWVAKPRTAQEYAAMSPRRAAIHRFMAALFPDPAKTIESAKNLVLGTRPETAPSLILLGAATLEESLQKALGTHAAKIEALAAPVVQSPVTVNVTATMPAPAPIPAKAPPEVTQEELHDAID